MLLTIMETCIPQKGVNAESTKWLGSHRPKKCMCVYIYTYVVLKVDVNWVKNQYSYHMLGNIYIYIYIHINMCIYICILYWNIEWFIDVYVLIHLNINSSLPNLDP